LIILITFIGVTGCCAAEEPLDEVLGLLVDEDVLVLLVVDEDVLVLLLVVFVVVPVVLALG
jgi:hypothetical protein